METARQVMTQAAFARHMGVSRAAVSQWKSKKILRDDAFTEDGKRLFVEIAAEQVRRNRDIGQSLGNGIGTGSKAPRSGDSPAAQADLPIGPEDPDEAPAPARAQVVDTVQDQIARAKLEEQLRRNRIQAAEEALQQGKLMAAEEVREQMMRIAGMMLQVFEGALPEFASKVSEKFDVPQRDILHLLREEFRKVRQDAARKEKNRASATDKSSAAELDSED